MKIIKVNDYIYQIEFSQSNKFSLYSTNIFVVLDHKRALIIDARYYHHAEEVTKVLDAEGIKPEIVIYSHFHPDHIYGGKDFKGCKFIGSKYYKNNFEHFSKQHPENEFIEPDFLVDEKYSFKFGMHDISLIHVPCHLEIRFFACLTYGRYYLDFLWHLSCILPYEHQKRI